jgi:hypothetical protein
MSKHTYADIPGLSDVFLEDSFVLGLEETDNELRFQLDLILLRGHPLYRTPRPNEQYCFRRAQLRFPAVRRATWHERTFVPYTDATNTVDYGNIYDFHAIDAVYHLSGAWGNVEIESAPPVLEFPPEASNPEEAPIVEA